MQELISIARRVVRPLASAVVLSMAVGGALAATLPATGPSTQDIVEFTRIIQPLDQDPDLLRKQVSPDGRQAFIVTRRGDVRRDLTHYEILLLDLDPERLQTGTFRKPKPVLTLDAASDNNYSKPFVQDVEWFGSRMLVLRARVNGAPYQAYTIDLSSGRLTQLTYAPQGVSSFSLSSDRRRVVYASPLPNPPMSPGEQSLVVENRSFWSVKFGQNDLRSQKRRYGYFVTDSGSRKPARQLGESVDEIGSWPRVSISPDGKWALLPIPAPEEQLRWSREYPFVAEQTTRYGPAAMLDPMNYFTNPGGWIPRRMAVYSLATGAAHLVVDAPGDADGFAGQLRSDRLWQGSGESVVLAGTLLPASLRPPGAPVDASFVVEYWPQSKRMRVICKLDERLSSASTLRGERSGFEVIDGQRRRYFIRDRAGSWVEQAEQSATELAPKDGGWQLHIQQALNQPPDLVATGSGGTVVRLTRLNPRFDEAGWGTMRPYQWTDESGARWDGGLLLPHDLDRSKRYPLVIQTYGFAQDRFYLDGANEHDGWTSGFAGRAFLKEGILVLAVPLRSNDGLSKGFHGRLAAFPAGVKGAIRALVEEGLVDPDRVGILGWSATGEQVLNLVTFSDVPIRAASMLDGDSNTLFSSTITYGALDTIIAKKEDVNEGPAFGGTLERWMKNDPSLHTGCIHAALRIETYGPSGQNNWDVYALLRRQYKAAELVVIPEGSHSLSRPSHRMVSLQGNVDWYRFWLKGEERADVLIPGETERSLGQQYARWRQMEAMKATDDKRPHCALKMVVSSAFVGEKLIR